LIRQVYYCRLNGFTLGSVEMNTSLKRGANENSTIIPNRFDRTTGHCILARGPLGVVLRLLADVRICVLERAYEVGGRGFAADVAVDAGAINVERAEVVFFYTFVGIRH